MILGYKKKIKILSLNAFFIKLKYLIKTNIIYMQGFYGIAKIFWSLSKFLDFNYLKDKLYNYWYELHVGFIGILYLNGLGFKCTKKLFYASTKKFWRFNVGHSHVFWYFTPKNLIMKVKQRFIFLFGYFKNQIFDILKKLKNFHIPDSYKGIGLKFPNEYIRLKKGKVRQ